MFWAITKITTISDKSGSLVLTTLSWLLISLYASNRQVAKSDDFDKSGRWLVTTEDRVSGHRSTQVFDTVLVCTGHHAERYIPELPGAADFRGKVMHTHDYRAPYGFDGKTVAIIGMGNSAGDMAVDVAQHAKQVIVNNIVCGLDF